MLRTRGKEYCIFFLAIAGFLHGHLAFSQQVQRVSPAGTKFFVYTPSTYNQGTPAPLLVSLHGLGGVGDDLNLLLTHKDQIPAKLIAQNQWDPARPFIVVTPQLQEDKSLPNPKEQLWPPALVDEVIEFVKDNYAVNDRKIYITGLSLGAHGSYSYAAAYPSKIAGLVMISGAPDSTLACQVKDIPLWAFHGSDDGQVWPVFAQGVIRNINDCTPQAKFRPRLDLFYGSRHEGWDAVYNNSSGFNVYDWLLKFTKNDPANTKPYVNAGQDLRIAHRNKPLYIYGEYFDSDGEIVSATWTQTAGPTATLGDVNSRILKLSGYSVGTYKFQLQVRDNLGGQSTDEVTITIVPENNGEIAVTGLELLRASNNQTPVASLYDGFVINPDELNTWEINISASVRGNPGSVRFQINGNENNRTVNNPPYELAAPKWTVDGGKYLVCATPYSGRNGGGTAGVTQCFSVVVSTTATSPPPEEPEEPEEPVDPEEPEEPVDPEEPEEPVDPEEPEEPVDPEEPEEPVDPEEPEEPVDPEEPEEPVDPEEPEEPVDPEEPEEPVDPEEPEEPVDPEEPEEPVDPEEPEEPVDPEEPEEPVDPEEPEEPVDPEEPEEPVDPEEPEEPVDPEEPEEPVDPEEPEEPVDPEEPEEPVDPEEPEEPVDPEEPEEPVDPEEPEEPVDPEPPADIAHFYAKNGTDISQLNSWSSNPQGTGTPPPNFTAAGLTFDILHPVVLENPLTIGGAGSVVRIRGGGELILNNLLAATVAMDAQAKLQVNTAHPLQLGTLHAASAVYLNGAVATVPLATYGHLYISGEGVSKALSSGVTRVQGNLVIGDGVKLEGAPTAASVLSLSGDLTFSGTTPVVPENPYSLTFDKGSPQNFYLNATHVAFHQITVAPNTHLQLAGPGESLLQLGSATGGGLTVEAGGRMLMRSNDLYIQQNGTLNPQNQTGQVGFHKSVLRIESTASTQSHLYPVAGADSLSSLQIDLAGSGNFSLQGLVYLVDDVQVTAGTLSSNGNLALVSTPSATARVLAGEGTITGDVIFQRFIRKGNQIRYLGFPVKGVTAADVQSFIPITGSFSGASTGGSLPAGASAHRYNDAAGGWVAWPAQHNAETFEIGTGYSVLMTQQTTDTKLLVAGPLHQGDLNYALTPNPGNDPDRGWNLIANPYASPIRWAQEGWVRDDVGAASYVFDDRYPGGRFLVWDGTIGDEEFAGIISQGQGFFVRSTGDDPALTVTELTKTDTSTNLWRQERTSAENDHLIVTLSHNTLVDRTYVKFSDQALDEFDESDAVKRKNGYFSLSTLSSDGISLAINNMQKTFCDRSIVIGMDTQQPGDYALIFHGSGLAAGDIHLMDHFTDAVTAIRPGTPYNFKISADPASSEKTRFEIQIPSAALQAPEMVLEGEVLYSSSASGNQWFLNGSEIEGATEATYAPEVSGDYSLSVTADGCTFTTDPVFVTVTVTGIHENPDQQVMVYPNPASHSLNIRLHALPAGNLHYSIINTMGVQVAYGEIRAETILQGSEINVAEFPSGVYFLNLRSTGWKYQGKFVVDSRGP